MKERQGLGYQWETRSWRNKMRGRRRGQRGGGTWDTSVTDKISRPFNKLGARVTTDDDVVGDDEDDEEGGDVFAMAAASP